MCDNQNPEQRARDRIDKQLGEAGCTVQSLVELNPSATRGVAVREYPTNTGPMDYLLMVDGVPPESSKPSARRKATGSARRPYERDRHIRG